MANRSVVLLCVILLVSCPALAQRDTATSISAMRYILSLHAGGLLAEKNLGSSLTVSALQTVHYKRLGIGAGVGYDTYYEWRTLPVFASADYDVISRDAWALYLRMNGGYAKAWYLPADENQSSVTNEHAGGFFFHPTVGIRMQRGPMIVFFSAGYKVQKLNYEQGPRWWIWGYPQTTKVTVDRQTERLSIQIGIGFSGPRHATGN